MNKLEQAMRQTLEALECNDLRFAIDNYPTGGTVRGAGQRAITALREALEHIGDGNKMVEQPAQQEPVRDMPHGWVQNWPSPNGGTKPVYHASAIKPKYGEEFDGKLTMYPVYTRPQASEPLTWQPIETAPKDSTSVLIYCPKSDRKPVCEAWWAIAYEGDSGGHWQTPIGPSGRGYTILATSPTHWMPLPLKPDYGIKATQQANTPTDPTDWSAA